MTRVYTKIGDIFSVDLNDGSKKYFQYIARDLTQLNSDVIRVFETIYDVNEMPFLEDIIKDEVDFYVHCVVKWGVKLGFWKKAGHIAEVGNVNNILFRSTPDYGRKVGEPPIRISKNWWVWTINQDMKHVGLLKGENRQAEIGLVIDAESIVCRMKTGDYGFGYPDFE